MNELVLISPNNLPNIINLVYPKIDAATAYSNGKYQGSDILQQLVSGHMQLWAAVNENEEIQAIAITEIANYPRIRVMRFLCATGENVEEWINHIDAMEAWGQSHGCKDFEAVVRPGWQKLLKPKGYATSHVIVNKDIGTCH
jgi:hypothetical protein